METEKEKKKENNSEEVTGTKEAEKEEQVIILRPLNMDDMRQAKNQVNICIFLNFDASRLHLPRLPHGLCS